MCTSLGNIYLCLVSTIVSHAQEQTATWVERLVLDWLSQQNKLSAGERRERQKDFCLKCNYNPIFICKYPKQMLRQMEFPRQLDVIP